jgi:predicted Rossmann fold flavoprotein
VTYDIAVIGAGPAGMMAAIRAGELKKNVILIERNDSPGKKILLTGKGRCNVTNTASIDEFISRFGRQGQFLRQAFNSFSNNDLMEFFRKHGLELEIERQGRVFPKTDKAISVVRALAKALSDNNVKVLYNARLLSLHKKSGVFTLKLHDNNAVQAKRVILATGGASFKATGSTGDGFHIAKQLGHTYIPLTPGLVPLKTKEPWVKQVQGLTLKNIRLNFICGSKKITSEIGELLFTHFGVSGPLVLDLSGEIILLLKEHKEAKLTIDLKPGLTLEQLEKRLLSDIKEQGSKNLDNFLKEYLPISMIPVFIHLLKLDGTKKCAYLAQKERQALIQLLKALPLTITGSLALEEAMVTCGGVSTKEINPRTMESRLVHSLYFAGEIIDATAPSGGYNLQQAFSTGYLAGEQAVLCVK